MKVKQVADYERTNDLCRRSKKIIAARLDNGREHFRAELPDTRKRNSIGQLVGPSIRCRIFSCLPRPAIVIFLNVAGRVFYRFWFWPVPLAGLIHFRYALSKEVQAT